MLKVRATSILTQAGGQVTSRSPHSALAHHSHIPISRPIPTYLSLVTHHIYTGKYNLATIAIFL